MRFRGMHRFGGRVAVVGLVVSGVALTAATAPAGAAVPCAVTTQRTDTPAGDAGWDPVLSADGSVVVFVSDANIGGQNADGTDEVWRRVGNVTTKLTSNPADAEIRRPDLSADGSRVVFSTTADLMNGNDDGNEELFLWDASANPQLEQITDTSGAANKRPRISASGNRIVFQSEIDWDSANPDGSDEVFLRDLSAGTTTQISENTEQGAKKPAISGDGNVVVYESDGDLGSNPDRNLEIFRYSLLSGTTTQITNAAAGPGQEGWEGSYKPSIDGDGSTVVFETVVAHGALNTALNYAMLRWDTGTLTMVSTDGGGSSVSADGTRVAFISDQDLVGQNADENEEVFVHHGGTIRQLTRTTGGESNGARISRNGNHIAFGSDRNFLGTNGDGSYEVFVATCGPELKCDGQVVTVVLGQNSPTAARDVIYGTRGNDGTSLRPVNGGDGNDVFCGLAGNDRFNGGSGNDRFLGDAGNDTADGGAGADVLKGQAGNDTLIGGSGRPDVCDGGAGDRDSAARSCEQRLNIP